MPCSRRHLSLGLGLILGLLTWTSARARETPTPGDNDSRSAVAMDWFGGHLSVPGPTLGGSQFWTDQLVFHDWRIQRNVYTGHSRLLDGYNIRHAYGSFDRCRERLDEIRHEHFLPKMTGRVLLAVHGLGGTRGLMRPLTNYLEEQGGYTVCAFEYASTRGTVEDHALALQRVLDGWPDVEEIHIVAHSLGNIVVRRCMADQMRARGGRIDPRITCMVMLAPPNHGSELAERYVAERGVAFSVVGPAARELGDGWEQLRPTLVTPPCRFGIIAGGVGNRIGLSGALPGDDDGVVTVASARLEGAADFLVVPLFHTSLPIDPRVARCTLRFLRDGRFTTSDEADAWERPEVDFDPPSREWDKSS